MFINEDKMNHKLNYITATFRFPVELSCVLKKFVIKQSEDIYGDVIFGFRNIFYGFEGCINIYDIKCY